MTLELRVAVAAGLLIAAASCGDDGKSSGAASKTPDRSPGSSFEQPYTEVAAYPVFVNSEIVVGENRFLVGLLNDEDAPIASADIDMHIDFYDLERSDESPVFGKEMEFLHTGPRGLYVTEVTFDDAGKWGAEVTVEGQGLDETVRGSFQVTKQAATPALGERPPASDTPTLDDVGKLSSITTDHRPAPRFYRTSIAQALESSKPFVVVFATPKFCNSQFCGPTLDIVKSVAKRWPDVTFIHVEVYKNLDEPSNLKPVEAVNEWRLPSEPWVFVVDGEGKVVAKYEGTLAAEELHAALQTRL